MTIAQLLLGKVDKASKVEETTYKSTKTKQDDSIDGLVKCVICFVLGWMMAPF